MAAESCLARKSPRLSLWQCSVIGRVLSLDDPNRQPSLGGVQLRRREPCDSHVQRSKNRGITTTHVSRSNHGQKKIHCQVSPRVELRFPEFLTRSKSGVMTTTLRNQLRLKLTYCAIYSYISLETLVNIAATMFKLASIYMGNTNPLPTLSVRL